MPPGPDGTLGGGSVGSFWPWMSCMGGIAARNDESSCWVSCAAFASWASQSACQLSRSPWRACDALVWAWISSGVGGMPGVGLIGG